jgi:hypothetical protein
MNEPVAIRYDFDGYGYQYMDSGSGSDWQTRVDGQLLYTHPSEHDLGIAKAIGFDKGYKTAAQSNTQLHPGKTLTDEEIDAIENAVYCKTIQKGKTPHEYIMKFARAILKKASEK